MKANPIIAQLRELSEAFKMWRVVDKDTGSYYIEFEEWASIEAKEWFAAHSAKYPVDFKNRELRLVIIKSSQAVLAKEAADEIERLHGLIRNVIYGAWCVTDLQEAIGELNAAEESESKEGTK